MVTQSSDVIERDSVDLPGVSASAPQSLELVRRLPVRMQGWTWVKVKSKLCKRDSDWKRRYATIRGGVLLLDKLGRNTSLQVVQDTNDDWYTTVDLYNFQVEPVRKRLVIELSRPDDTLKIKVRLNTEDDFNLWLLRLERELELFHFDAAQFNFERQVGEGSMGKVYKINKVNGDKSLPLAMKILDKSFIEQHADTMRMAMDERAVLELVGDHPFVLGLRYAVETTSQFCFVTEFCERGDLFNFMTQRRRPLLEEKARILAAEIAMGLEHVHSFGVVYRDLKTENVLVDKDGHVRIADFGLAKILGRSREQAVLSRTDTLCGTTNYYAPEMLMDEGYSQGIDYWALGVLLHFVLTGNMPCEGTEEEREDIIRRLKTEPITISDELTPPCKSLLLGLLEKDPEKRLGRSGIQDLKNHEFFSEFNWEAAHHRNCGGIFEKYEGRLCRSTLPAFSATGAMLIYATQIFVCAQRPGASTAWWTNRRALTFGG
mmetsp:Transcript_6464/g.19613  ORF Transcript_6464/g.19613 Transcript_6464/m.19613 type:complete len:488 (+) Transcript_6464:153-1616(+)